MSRLQHIERTSCILIGSSFKKPNHCRTDAFLTSGLKPKAVQKAGKAVITGVCLMSEQGPVRGQCAGQQSKNKQPRLSLLIGWAAYSPPPPAVLLTEHRYSVSRKRLRGTVAMTTQSSEGSDCTHTHRAWQVEAHTLPALNNHKCPLEPIGPAVRVQMGQGREI